MTSIRGALSPLWRRLPLLDRWLLGQLLGPLLFGVAAFTAVSLSVGVVFELVRKVAEAGLPVGTAMQVLGLRLPAFLVLSFPMATLMATLLAYSRLSGNSELTALRSLGVKTWRMVLPALALALAMSLLTFFFNDIVVPSANRVAAITLNRALGQAIAAERGENTIYSRFDGSHTIDSGSTIKSLAQIFHAEEYRDGQMRGVTVLDFSRRGQKQLLSARIGLWNDARGMWEFRDGRVVNVDVASGLSTSVSFDRYFYPLGRDPIATAELPRDPSTMTVAQAVQAETLLRHAGDSKEARRLRVRIQEKFSFPMVCLVFGLVGSSLGVRPQDRSSKSQGFGISVLLIFGYYLLSFIFSSLGIKGSLSPFAAAWSPVMIGLAAGGLIMRQASR